MIPARSTPVPANTYGSSETHPGMVTIGGAEPAPSYISRGRMAIAAVYRRPFSRPVLSGWEPKGTTHSRPSARIRAKYVWQ